MNENKKLYIEIAPHEKAQIKRKRLSFRVPRPSVSIKKRKVPAMCKMVKSITLIFMSESRERCESRVAPARAHSDPLALLPFLFISRYRYTLDIARGFAYFLARTRL